ncbi:hypothetical protein [Bryobacter aggregatus]|uniref:hypothetical protein n=1 Tax=Bryobacter aggregatus TaxID=360054 RepID=UPI0004E27F40|nr:hypothetical protein [Bryobacter aggregatus]
MKQTWLTSVALTLCGSAAVLAQDSFQAGWDAARSKQAPGVEFMLSTDKSKYYLGEVIPLTLSFLTTQAQTFATLPAPRTSGPSPWEALTLDPDDSQPAARMVQGGFAGSGPMGNVQFLSPEQPSQNTVFLNDWSPIHKPGTYRIYLVSRRISQLTEPGLPAMELRNSNNRTPLELASNIIQIEIVQPPPQWVAERIREATATLDAPPQQDPEMQSHAFQILRFLDTPESASALITHIPEEYTAETYPVTQAILNSAHWEQVLPQMQQQLNAPRQPINETFLKTLTELSLRKKLGRLTPPESQTPEAQLRWQNVATQRAHQFEEQQASLASQLLAALPKKTPEARSQSRETLIRLAVSSATTPPWADAFLAEMIADFHSLTTRQQEDLLSSRWYLVRRAKILPILLEYYASPPNSPSRSIIDLVVQRIYELAPDQGRQIILKELHKQEDQLLGLSTVMMLPDPVLPELHEVFLAQMARGGSPPGHLITRYANGDILPAVKARFLAFVAELDRQKLPHCTHPLIFYFLKYDPDFGRQQLIQSFASCNYQSIVNGIDPLGRYAMSSALESIAIEQLPSGIVGIKRGAAELLGRYGSKAAQKPLWDTIEYFRNWWKDREADLQTPIGEESRILERTLASALGQAQNWVLDSRGLDRLHSLCSSKECRAFVQDWIHKTNGAIAINYSDIPPQPAFFVAQYSVRGTAALQEKLSQFPAGSRFRIEDTPSDRTAHLRAAVESALRAAGHRLEP